MQSFPCEHSHPFRDHANTLREELEGDTEVLGALHVVRFGLKAMEEVCDRLQQRCSGPRPRKDPFVQDPQRAGGGSANFIGR